MNAFELVEPSSLVEALGLLDPNDSAVRPIAGGTYVARNLIST
jgi:CO/xanthine dehydrogenase FAD-binding subunit